jgi:hypothetical protein
MGARNRVKIYTSLMSSFCWSGLSPASGSGSKAGGSQMEFFGKCLDEILADR